MPITSPNCVATAWSNDAATAIADGNAVAFADAALVNAAAPLDAQPAGTQSFWPIPTGPFLMRSVGMWYFGNPGM